MKPSWNLLFSQFGVSSIIKSKLSSANEVSTKLSGFLTLCQDEEEVAHLVWFPAYLLCDSSNSILKNTLEIVSDYFKAKSEDYVKYILCNSSVSEDEFVELETHASSSTVSSPESFEMLPSVWHIEAPNTLDPFTLIIPLSQIEKFRTKNDKEISLFLIQGAAKNSLSSFEFIIENNFRMEVFYKCLLSFCKIQIAHEKVAANIVEYRLCNARSSSGYHPLSVPPSFAWINSQKLLPFVEKIRPRFNQTKWNILDKFSRVTAAINEVKDFLNPESSEAAAEEAPIFFLREFPPAKLPSPYRFELMELNKNHSNLREMIISVSQGGLHYSLRKEYWKFFLAFYDDWFISKETIDEIRERTANEYYSKISPSWNNPFSASILSFGFLSEEIHKIEKDVLRTDRSEPFYHIKEEFLPHIQFSDISTIESFALADFKQNNLNILRNVLMSYASFHFVQEGVKTDELCSSTGYVQGMTDLLSPILFVMQDESDAFYCFNQLMKSLKYNFDHDSSAIHNQLATLRSLIQFLRPDLYRFLADRDSLHLFFCYRWFLVLFKREFKFSDILTLWEVLFAKSMVLSGSSSQIQLLESFPYKFFIALSILDISREMYFEADGFDAILKAIVNLSNELDLGRVLQQAQILCAAFKSKMGRMEIQFFHNEELTALYKDIQRCFACQV